MGSSRSCHKQDIIISKSILLLNTLKINPNYILRYHGHIFLLSIIQIHCSDLQNNLPGCNFDFLYYFKHANFDFIFKKLQLLLKIHFTRFLKSEKLILRLRLRSYFLSCSDIFMKMLLFGWKNF